MQVDTLAQQGDEKANVLIVDDLPEKLLVFRTVLEELGQNLVLVQSGAAALREMLQREFAVILLDVNMPGMDGFETATLIRQHRRSANTPIIFITSYADEIQTTRGYSLGAVDYILSPVVPEILRSKVKVFVSLYLMQRQIHHQANARAEMMAEQAARRVAEENDRRSAFLANASRALSGSLEISVAMNQLVELLVPELAALAVLLPVDAELGASEMLGAAARPGETSLRWSASAEAQLDQGIRDAMRRAVDKRRRTAATLPHPQVLTAASFGLSRPGGAFPHLSSATALPLLSGERVLAVLLLGFEEAGALSGPDASMLNELAARAATAFENARLYRILQREILERQAAQDALQEASQRKDEFLAMMSHELRNPLAPIHTAVEVIRRVSAPNPRVSWALDIADRQLRQMTHLIEELLDVSRISQNKIVLKRELINLCTVIGHGVETVQPFVDSRRQTLTVALADEDAWLKGDAARLTQVISNLLHNASKYSPEGTVIALQCGLEDGGIVVSVRDQGIGIDAELLPRIFDLFAQGKRGLDRAQGGLGVGLTLARRLTEMHGGRIEVESKGRDQGSEFRIRLPRMAQAQEAQAITVPIATVPRLEAQRILIVDDNHDAASGIGAVLELEGHQVRTAGDGEEALALAASYRPSVILLDIGLPLVDGYEVARRMRQRPETEEALLIALTGYGQSEDRQAALSAGFDHHFVKPADAAALLACMRLWLEQGGTRSGPAEGDSRVN